METNPKSIPQALGDLFIALEQLRQALNQHYLDRSKLFGSPIKAHLDAQETFFQALSLSQSPEWQKRVATAIFRSWSPLSLLGDRPRRRRRRPSSFPVKK